MRLTARPDAFMLVVTRFVAALALGACVPSRATPFAGLTPGQSVVVTDESYISGFFQARYPDGWRVITSPAGESPFVTFVAPDNCSLIVLSVEPRTAPPLSADCGTDAIERELTDTAGDDALVHAAGRSTADPDDFTRAWEFVLSSITT